MVLLPTHRHLEHEKCLLWDGARVGVLLRIGGRELRVAINTTGIIWPHGITIVY